MAKLTQKQCDVISALAFSSMNIAAAQKILGCARTNVEWHITRIKELTGLDAKDFFDLHELYRIAGEVDDEQSR